MGIKSHQDFSLLNSDPVSMVGDRCLSTEQPVVSLSPFMNATFLDNRAIISPTTTATYKESAN